MLNFLDTSPRFRMTVQKMKQEKLSFQKTIMLLVQKKKEKKVMKEKVMKEKKVLGPNPL